MGFVYSALWLIIALILFFRFRKQSMIVYPLCIYFIFLCVWWAANEFTSADMLNGTPGWLLRVISAVVLLVCCIFYFREKKQNSGDIDKKD